MLACVRGACRRTFDAEAVWFDVVIEADRPRVPRDARGPGVDARREDRAVTIWM